MGVSSYDKSTAHRRLEHEFVALDNAVNRKGRIHVRF